MYLASVQNIEWCDNIVPHTLANVVAPPCGILFEIPFLKIVHFWVELIPLPHKIGQKWTFKVVLWMGCFI